MPYSARRKTRTHSAVVVTKPVVASAFSPAVCSLFPLSARCVEGCDRLLRNRERRFRDDAGGCYLAELQQRAGLVHRGGTLRCTATTPSLPCAQLSPAGLKTVMLVGVLHAHRFPLTCLQLREKREELNKSIEWLSTPHQDVEFPVAPSFENGFLATDVDKKRFLENPRQIKRTNRITKIHAELRKSAES